MNIADRAAGAVIGALIGDALGLGPHWYYDLAELRRDYGDWISGYTDPKPGRYHTGMKAGQLSQTGLILVMLLRSVVEKGTYDGAAFTERLDRELFPYLDGTPMQGPGGYTSQSIREAYRARVVQKLDWTQTGGHADTTEAAERAVVLAARYAINLRKVAEKVSTNCLLTQADEAIVAMTTAFNCVVALLVTGEKLDVLISDKLMDQVKAGHLPFHAVTSGNLQMPRPGDSDRQVLISRCPPDTIVHGGSGA
jgi:ADP-ribosylglycohydrolase